MDLSCPLSLVVFGEAEKGNYRTPYYCTSLPQLVEQLGHPPGDSKGLFFAVQSLLYFHPLAFIRVQEEGFSLYDYLAGLKSMEENLWLQRAAAIAAPGLGDLEIIEALVPVCKQNHQFLIAQEKDLYDFLTS